MSPKKRLNPTSPLKNSMVTWMWKKHKMWKFTSSEPSNSSFATTTDVAPWNPSFKGIALLHGAIQDHHNDPALILASFINRPGYTSFQWDSQMPHKAGTTTAVWPSSDNLLTCARRKIISPSTSYLHPPLHPFPSLVDTVDGYVFRLPAPVHPEAETPTSSNVKSLSPSRETSFWCPAKKSEKTYKGRADQLRSVCNWYHQWLL